MLQLVTTGRCVADLPLQKNRLDSCIAPAHDGPDAGLRPPCCRIGRCDWPNRARADHARSSAIGATGVEVMLAGLHWFTLRLDPPIRVHRLFAAARALLPGHNARAVRRAELALQRANDVPVILGGAGSRRSVLPATGCSGPPEPSRPSGCAERPAAQRRRLCGRAVTLQSTSHASVFCSGRQAPRSPPLGKSDCARRAYGATLAHNLRAALFGHALLHPSATPLLCWPCPTVAAPSPAEAAGWPAQGRAVGWWKDWLDHRFMRRFFPLLLPTP